MAKNHIVKQGESLSQIAERYGFGDYLLIYNAPENADLRRRRPNPNLLFPGDVVAIPPLKPKTSSGKVGRASSFVVQRPSHILRLRLLDHAHRPLANVEYELDVLSGPELRGKSTDGRGQIEVSLPHHCKEADLRIGGRSYRLRLGYLNPLRLSPDQGISGLQSRLKNLGYYGGPANGRLDDATRVAAALFQSDFKLSVNGEADGPTTQRLEQIHGS